MKPIKNEATEAKAQAIAALGVTDREAANAEFKAFVAGSTMVRWEVLAFQDRILFLINEMKAAQGLPVEPTAAEVARAAMDKADAAPVFDIDMQVVAWAKQHDWFHSWEHNADGYIGIWATENGKLHPWPFMNRKELRAWAGYWTLTMTKSTHAAWKLGLCVRLARECSRDSWQQPAKDKAEFLRIKRESMADAREWKADL